MSDDEPDMTLVLAEVDALRRLVELEELRRIRLEARVSGRTGEVVFWCESGDEEDDEATRLALRAFPPSAWWRDV